jgi:peroxiredoxin
LDRSREQFERAGVRLVLIGQATPRQAAHFRSKLGIGLPVLADDRREAYAAVGAKVGGIGDLVGPKVVAKSVGAIARSRRLQGRTVGHPAQLGGVVVIARGGELAWSRMAQDASDNATAEEILTAATPGPHRSPMSSA